MFLQSTIFKTAVVTAALILTTPFLHGQRRTQQQLIPTLFPGVQIGSVVFEDGTIVRTQAFALENLAPNIEVQSLQTREQFITGNSTYNTAASATSWLGSVSFEFGFGAFGMSGNFESTESSASQAQTTLLTSLMVGTNRLAYIDFQRLSPNTLMASLSPNLLRETSSLQQMASAIRDLELHLQTSRDPNSKKARQLIADLAAAQARFKRNYGVGFVSGVVLGGAAAVQGEFSASSTSSQSRFNTSGRVYGASTKTRFELRTAFGTMNSNQLGRASFSVTSSALGGSTYEAFADRFFNQFADRSLSQLWDQNFAQLPSTAGLIGSQQPNLPPFNKPPDKVPSLASKFGPIKDSNQLNLYNRALAFDRWNKKKANGRGTFQQFEAFEREQLAAASTRSDTPVVVEAGTQTRRLAAKSVAEVDYQPEFLDEETLLAKRSTDFQQRYWSALQQNFEVIAVETTRWEDVIPGLGFAEALIANTVAGREFVESREVLQSFRFISNMYSLASTCTFDGRVGSRVRETTNYLALANAFLRYERDLSALITGQANPLAIVQDYLATMPIDDLAIYQVFALNRELFTAGELGMGGYGVFRQTAPNRNKVRVRFEGLDNLVPRNAGARFSTRLGFAEPTRRELHAPILYKTAVKLFPLLEPDIENFVADGENSRYDARIRLMASTFDPDGNGTSVNGFLSRLPNTTGLFSSGDSTRDIIEIPLQRVRSTKRFGNREFILPIAPNSTSVFAYNSPNRSASWMAPSALERLRNRSQFYVLNEIRLVPFTVKDILGLPGWRGFIAYERATETVLEEFWRELTRNFARNARGVNYFTEAFRRRPIDLDQNFDPADLNQFFSYLGLVSPPANSVAPREQALK